MQFLPLFAGFLVVYRVIVRPYNAVVVALANAVLSNLQPEIHITINAMGGWDFKPAGPAGPTFNAAIGDLTFAYLNIALLPALVLATPMKLIERARTLLWGLLVMFGLHVISPVVIVRAMLGLYYDPESVLCHWLLFVFATGGQVFGVVLWALLTWRFWLEHLVPPATVPDGPASLPRNALCPCGSGQKYKHCCGGHSKARRTLP